MTANTENGGQANLHVLNVLFEERFGGPQSRVLQVAAGLLEAGVRTTVAMPRGNTAFAGRLREIGIPCLELPLVRLGRHTVRDRHVSYPIDFVRNTLLLRRVIRKHGIDLVHTNGLANAQAALAARLEHVPLVWHLNDVLMPFAVRVVCVPLCRAWATRIAVSSQAVARFHFPDVSSVRSRLQVVYPPVDAARFGNGARDAIRHELGISDSAPVIGTVGNISPAKGIEVLLEAAPLVLKQFPEAVFVVAGELLATRRRYWEPFVARSARPDLKGHVLFLGRRDDVADLLSAFDIYAHPSVSEAAGMAVLEASASRLPVVACDVGGVAEVVADGQTGILLPPRNPSEFAAALIRLLSSSETRRSMGCAGAERVGRLFSLEQSVQSHLHLYRSAAGGL